MDRLKSTLLEIRQEDAQKEGERDRIEVVGPSVSACLEQAATYWNTDLTALDYEIIEKGKKSFFNSKPYRLQVQLLETNQDLTELEEFSFKLGVGQRLLDKSLDKHATQINKDGQAVVRNYLDGVFLFIFPPIGNGAALIHSEVIVRIQRSGVENYDDVAVQEALNASSGKPVRIADFSPNPENDSTCKVTIAPDHMSASIYIVPPKFGGCHLRASDIAGILKAQDVVVGFQQEKVEQALLDDDCYMQEIVAAKGIPPQHGENARIDYKVNVRKSIPNLQEDMDGRVDFKNLSLIENVVTGQTLAEKIPGTKGKTGYTIFNRLVEARDGKDVEFKRGNGTLLVDNKMKLIAGINGQAVLSRDRIAVKPVHRILGNVGPRTGNISFLGSVLIGGSVLNEFKVTASGNIEIQGSTQQKSCIEADGDIIVRSGVQGAQVHSSGGSVIVKYVQDAEISAAKDVIVTDGILRSKVDAGNAIICNGRRAQILGGRLRAKNEVYALMIGSRAHTATEITVGVDPIIISRYEEVSKLLVELTEKIKQTQKAAGVLEKRKAMPTGSFNAEQEKTLNTHRETLLQLEEKKKELSREYEELNSHFEVPTSEARVHVVKQIFPRVTVNILKAQQEMHETYNSVTLSYDQGYVKINKLEKKQEVTGISKLRAARPGITHLSYK